MLKLNTLNKLAIPCIILKAYSRLICVCTKNLAQVYTDVSIFLFAELSYALGV